MERITHENTKEMGMYQLAHNHVFIKDGWAWYRDYDREISVINLIKEIVHTHTFDASVILADVDDFGEIMLDNLQFGTEELIGVIALFYQTLWGMADIRERLKHYEDIGLDPEEIEGLKKSEDYWHREALKNAAELGEMKMKLKALMESLIPTPKDV